MWYKKTAVALLACTAFAAQAQAANVTTEFSVGSNPGGAWSYGWTPGLGNNFNLDLFNWTLASNSSVAVGWARENPANVADANPSVLYLINGSGPLFSYGTISAPSNSVNLHPGPSGELAVARWIAPTAGTYLISGAFRGNNVSGTTTDVHVLHNSSAIMNDSVSAFAQTKGFSQTVFLAAGDRVGNVPESVERLS